MNSSQKEAQIDNKYMKNVPSLAIREMGLRLHLTPINMSYHQGNKQQKMLARMWGKWNPRIKFNRLELPKGLSLLLIFSPFNLSLLFSLVQTHLVS
jgi:hypothetical protein